MTKYFSKEQIMKVMEEQNLMLDDIWGVEQRLDELQGADVAPVVHARWKWIWDTCSMGSVQTMRCSHCLKRLERAEEYEGRYPLYCQYCGAKMDGGKSK